MAWAFQAAPRVGRGGCRSASPSPQRPCVLPHGLGQSERRGDRGSRRDLGRRAAAPRVLRTRIRRPSLRDLVSLGWSSRSPPLVLVNARALGPLWLAIVVVPASSRADGSRSGRFHDRGELRVAPIIAVGGASLGGLDAPGGSLSGQAEAADAPLVGGTFLAGLPHSIRATPDYLQQAVGCFGWLDTPLPRMVVLVLRRGDRRARRAGPRSRLRRVRSWSWSALLAAACIVPALVQGSSVARPGSSGRDGTPCSSTSASRSSPPGSSHGARRLDLTSPVGSPGLPPDLLAAYGVARVRLVLDRYVIGARLTGEMVSAPQWQPPFGWPLLAAPTRSASMALVAWSASQPSRAGSGDGWRGGRAAMEARRNGDRAARRDRIRLPVPDRHGGGERVYRRIAEILVGPGMPRSPT